MNCHSHVLFSWPPPIWKPFELKIWWVRQTLAFIFLTLLYWFLAIYIAILEVSMSKFQLKRFSKERWPKVDQVALILSYNIIMTHYVHLIQISSIKDIWNWLVDECKRMLIWRGRVAKIKVVKKLFSVLIRWRFDESNWLNMKNDNSLDKCLLNLDLLFE